MKRKNQIQRLVHAFSIKSAGGEVTQVTRQDMSILLNRPARPVSIELEYFSTTARSFNFLMIAANGEEIYRSPLILAGPIPRKRVFKMPLSTDFGLYEGTDAVITMSHATNPSISWIGNVMFEYKYPRPQFF